VNPAAAAALVAPLPPPPNLPPSQAGVTTAPQPPVPPAVGGPGGPGAPGAGQPQSMQPQSMQPQAPKRPARAIVKEKPTRRLQPGDLICRECGEGNAPVRKFCSRCGTSLAEAEIVKKKWWQKIFPKRNKKVLEAGQRPGREGVKKKKKIAWQPVMKYGRMIIGGLLLIGGILYAVYSPWRGFVNEKYNSAKDWVNDLLFQQQVEVRPTGPTPIQASTQSADPNDPAQGAANLAIDLDPSTYWLSAPTDAQPQLRIDFGRPVDLSGLIIHNGAGGDNETFLAFSRPSAIEVSFGAGSENFDLQDSTEQQDVRFDANDIQQLQITIVGTNPGGVSTAVGLSEIEFFLLD
jgi:hypothetical protein